MTKEVRIVRVANDYGIKVKRCCASCQHKYIINDGTRLCLEEKRPVSQNYRCKKWQMSYGLKNAGKSGGTVRNRYNKEVEIG